MKGIHPILVRYTLIFLLFAFFLLLLFVPIYQYVSNFTLKNELAYMLDKLRSGIVVIDDSITALNNTVVFTDRDSRFRLFKYGPLGRPINPYGLLELQDTFSGMVLSYSLIADAGILFSKDSIVTRRRIFYYTGQYSFYGQFLRCGDLSWDEWVGLLSSNSPFVPVRSYKSIDYGDYEAITFTARWSSANFPDEKILYGTLPVAKIIPLIADTDVAERGSIRIYDSWNKLLFEQGPDMGENAGGKIHILSAQSESNLIRIEIGIPVSLMYEKLRPVKNLIFLSAFITAVMTILLALFFAYQSSKPMRKLLARIDTAKNIRAEYERYKRNEGFKLFKGFQRIYSDLGESISVVDAKLERSLQTIERQTELLRAQIFDMALQRGIYAPEKYAGFQSVFPDFPKRFRLALIRCDSSGDPSFQETLAVQLELINVVKGQLPGIYTQGKDGNTVILLLSLSGDDDPWLTRLQALRSELNRRIDLPLSITLSDVFDKPSDLSRAWQQLQFIRALPGINYLTSVEQMKTIPPHNVQLPLSIAAMEMIYNALCNANDSTAAAILRECTGSLPKPEDPLISGLVGSMVSNMITQIKLENPSTLFNINVPVYVWGSQEDLFERQFPECFKQICGNIRQRQEKNITKFGQKILDYINLHLYDPDLYITMISEHFDISPPTLQKLVKNISGQTFLVYVEKRRLSRAHDMLVNGGHTVQEIAVSCGFSNTNSFYKAFKRNYGFSPSEIPNSNSRTMNR